MHADTITILGRYRIKSYRAGTTELLHATPWIKNLVVAGSGHGLNIIARRLIGDTTHDIIITEAKIGTGNTPPTTADTDLENTAVDGIVTANQSTDGPAALLEFFLTDAELPDDTYHEFGLFAGSQLFARSLIPGGYEKATGADTAVEYEMAFANAA